MIIAAIFGCLVLSFFFSGIETGVLLLNRARVRHLKECGSFGARVLLDFMHRPSRLSATVLVGNTLVNSLVIVLVAQAGVRWGGFLTAVAGVTLVSAILWIWGDLIPKALFRRFPNRLTTRLAPLLLVTSICLYPAVWLFDFFSRVAIHALGGKVSSRQMFVTREELKLMAREGAQNFMLSGEQLNLVASILDSPNATAKDVMRPRDQVLCVKPTQSVRERLTFASTTSYSRFPVDRETSFDLLPAESSGLSRAESSGHHRWEGLWVVYDALFGVKGGVRYPPRLPTTMPLEEILAELRKARSPLAIVIDREDNDVGVVTVDDVLRRYHGKIDL